MVQIEESLRTKGNKRKIRSNGIRPSWSLIWEGGLGQFVKRERKREKKRRRRRRRRGKVWIEMVLYELLWIGMDLMYISLFHF